MLIRVIEMIMRVSRPAVVSNPVIVTALVIHMRSVRVPVTIAEVMILMRLRRAMISRRPLRRRTSTTHRMTAAIPRMLR